ncbi:uncharacterized protein isoform X2 [Danio rerio]|uniref:Uncharacterized protein isoform X2 n=1 Tax=Danio rerio TaxID=7955 RepID=A0AC58IC15_DANRE
MSRINTLKHLILLSLIALNQTSNEHENRNESSTADLYKRKIFIVTTLTKKSKELVLVPLILKLYNGQQDQSLINAGFVVVLEGTNILEGCFWFILVLFAVSHLHCVKPLFKRCVRGNTWSTYVEMLELQRRR